jgi:3D (Asp-Asp-Asp) domain-containing protein
MSEKMKKMFVICFAMLISPLQLIDGYFNSRDIILNKMLSSSMFKNDPEVILAEITAYCTGSCCNSEIYTDEDGSIHVTDWSNKIAAGPARIDELMNAGIEIAAVDTTVIPFGSIIRYNGKLYAALDRGGLIKGNRIDLAKNDHAEASLFGRRKLQRVEVYKPENPDISARQIMSMKYSFNK